MIVNFGPTIKSSPYAYLVDDEEEFSHEIDPYVDTETEEANFDLVDKIHATPSQFVEFGIFMPGSGGIQNFSFKDRPYLRSIYDSNAQRTLLMAGRQVEKTLILQSLVSVEDGSLRQARDVEVGDRLATLNTTTGSNIEVGPVTWKSRVYKKPCVAIHTRQGHVTVVAKTHPMRVWGGWKEAGQLEDRDRLAVVRRCGEFVLTSDERDERISLTAYLIGDGHIGKYISFTSLPGPGLEDFLECLEQVGATVRISPKKLSRAVSARLHSGSVVKDWMEEDGLLGSHSGDKFVPQWIFGLSRKKTALFLNRLWSTDGHVKKNSKSKYSIEYCSTSSTLIHQVQALLWKFGVPSRIRENWPNYWKKRGIDKKAYILRVETRDGVSTFLSEIGALGKSEGVSPPEEIANNNRDTYPKEINDLIREILTSRGGDGWHENRDSSLHDSGLRRSLKYPPTRDKLGLYVDFFRMDESFDQRLVDVLEVHLNTDLYWDYIQKIEDVGEQDCVDFTVDPYSNFVADGFVTHNSTLLGNKILTHMALIPFFRALYVSPSNTQTKTFSKDRIKEPIDISPVMRTFTNTRMLQNILEKKFINGSQITMRFAFLNADRVRGIPADLVNIDEIQDILIDNIPVIEECASHSDHRIFIYSGTPKSLDNTIEHYWSRYSTQNEWTVPCRRHGTPKDAGTWHWNVLDEDNVGSKGLVCDKCGNLINPRDPSCTWVSMNPNPRVEKPFEGYRLPQLMVPWIEWSDILDKQRKYSRPKFHNEVLGRSFDSGTRPLTRADIKDNCWPQLSMSRYNEIKKWSTQHPIIMGIDWGTGEGSFTVMTLSGYLPFAPDKYTTFYAHRFEGVESEPKVQFEIIKRHIEDFNVRYVGVDYGGGFWPNDELIRTFGSEKIKRYQWVGNSKTKIKFDAQLGIPRFLCHRTEVMSDIFNAIKRRDVFRFPRWEEWEEVHGSDFLNIYSEYNERMRMNQYKHAPGSPDDTFHAFAFGFLASFYVHTRSDIILPTKEVDRDASPEDYDII